MKLNRKTKQSKIVRMTIDDRKNAIVKILNNSNYFSFHNISDYGFVWEGENLWTVEDEHGSPSELVLELDIKNNEVVPYTLTLNHFLLIQDHLNALARYVDDVWTKKQNL